MTRPKTQTKTPHRHHSIRKTQTHEHTTTKKSGVYKLPTFKTIKTQFIMPSRNRDRDRGPRARGLRYA